MKATMYGIPNCNTVKDAQKWLEDNNIEYHFHDFKKNGITEKQLKQWCTELGWETLVNRKGLTWRQLPSSKKEGLNESKAIKLMLEKPTLIKRPVLDVGTRRLVGFDISQYMAVFARP